MRRILAAGADGQQQLPEFFGVLRGEAVEAVRDDIHFGVARRLEFHREAARIGVADIVRNGGDAGEIGEARDHRRFPGDEQFRLAYFLGSGIGREGAGDDDALGVHGAGVIVTKGAVQRVHHGLRLRLCFRRERRNCARGEQRAQQNISREFPHSLLPCEE